MIEAPVRCNVMIVKRCAQQEACAQAAVADAGCCTCTACTMSRRERLDKLQALAFDDETDDDDDPDVDAPAVADASAQPAQASEHVDAQGLDGDQGPPSSLSAPTVCRSGAGAGTSSFPLSSNASSGHGQAQEAEQVRRAEEARSAGKKQFEASDCASASAASTPSPEELSGHTPRAPVVASAKPAAGRSAKGGKVGSYFERFKCLEQIFTWFSGREHDDEVPSCLLVSVYSCFRCLYYWGRAGRQPA